MSGWRISGRPPYAALRSTCAATKASSTSFPAPDPWSSWPTIPMAFSTVSSSAGSQAGSGRTSASSPMPCSTVRRKYAHGCFRSTSRQRRRLFALISRREKPRTSTWPRRPCSCFLRAVFRHRPIGWRRGVGCALAALRRPIMQRHRAPVMPVYFHGQNSRMFQIASHLSLTLRLSLIFKEVCDRMGRLSKLLSAA